MPRAAQRLLQAKINALAGFQPRQVEGGRPGLNIDRTGKLLGKMIFALGVRVGAVFGACRGGGDELANGGFALAAEITPCRALGDSSFGTKANVM